MRIILCYPKDIAENYEAKRPLLGLGYVATVLHNNNHLVKVMDMRLKSHTNEYFRQVIRDFKPDFVGFSLVALSLNQAYQLFDIVKKESNAKIIAAGPEVTLLPQKFLHRSDVDFIIMGEGEYSFSAFLNAYQRQQDYSEIPGLGFKGKGFTKINPPHPITDLDALPFPNWDLFPLKEYRKEVSKIKFPIMTSRGCPYTCKFCDSVKVNAGYRVRTPRNVVDEIEAVHTKYHNRNFQILDDNFAIFKQRAIDICDEIIARGLNNKITWVIGQGFSPSKGSYDLFKKMKDAGCLVVYFGVESADDDVLRAIRKPHTVAQVRMAVKAAHDAGLLVKAPFISGLPKSTYEKEKHYITFFKEVGIDMPKMCQLVPFPGTDMYEWVKENAHPLMDLDDMHEKASQTRGSLDTDLFVPAFETDDFPLAERKKILDEFQTESERWVLQRTFGKTVGSFMFIASRWKPIRKLGVKFLDIYYDQF